MKALPFFMLASLALVLAISWSCPASATWAHAQSAGQTVDTNTGWTQVPAFHGSLDLQPEWIEVQQANQHIEGQGYPMNTETSWWMIIVWMLIIWIPAFMLGLLAPGYGTIAGLLIMGAMVVVFHPSFMLVFFYMIMNGAILFWRGVS